MYDASCQVPLSHRLARPYTGLQKVFAYVAQSGYGALTGRFYYRIFTVVWWFCGRMVLEQTILLSDFYGKMISLSRSTKSSPSPPSTCKATCKSRESLCICCPCRQRSWTDRILLSGFYGNMTNLWAHSAWSIRILLSDVYGTMFLCRRLGYAWKTRHHHTGERQLVHFIGDHRTRWIQGDLLSSVQCGLAWCAS